jgi:glycosyltransferase involved in cell wall biosynthesis
MTKIFLETLDATGHEWRIVNRRFSNSVVEVGVFRLRKVASAVWMPFRLLASLLDFRPSIVVFFITNRTQSFLVDWALSELLRLFRVRRINYIHTVGFTSLAQRSRVLAWMVRRALQSAELTVHLSPSLSLDINRWVHESRIAFIPNTVQGAPNPHLADKAVVAPSVLYFSNLIPEKGAGAFIDLAIELTQEFRAVTFIAAGATADSAFADRLMEKIRDSGSQSRIIMTGAVIDQQEKWKLLLDASVLVFPSTYRFEAFPLVLVEALAAGTPVVTYRIAALSDQIENASAGIVAEAGASASLVIAVRSLLANPQYRAEMGRRARALYDTQFTLENYRLRWANVLTEGIE